MTRPLQVLTSPAKLSHGILHNTHLLFNLSHPCSQILVPIIKDETPKPPSNSTFSSNSRSPPSSETTITPYIPQTLTKLRSNHLSPLRISSCGSCIIVISCRGMFHKKRHRFSQPSEFTRDQNIGYDHSTLSSSSYGDHWRNLRRISVLEVFSSHRLNMFSCIRKDEVKQLIQKLSRNSIQGFVEVELRTLITELTYNNIMRMVSRKRYYGDDASDDEAKNISRVLIKEILENAGASNAVNFLPILKWFGYGDYEKKLVRLGKKMDCFLQGLIDEHRRQEEESNSSSSSNTMIDHLLSLQESQPHYYTDQIIKGLILVMILAGPDTTAVTLEWAMSSLLNSPDVLRKETLKYR